MVRYMSDILIIIYKRRPGKFKFQAYAHCAFAVLRVNCIFDIKIVPFLGPILIVVGG